MHERPVPIAGLGYGFVGKPCRIDGLQQPVTLPVFDGHQLHQVGGIRIVLRFVDFAAQCYVPGYQFFDVGAQFAADAGQSTQTAVIFLWLRGYDQDLKQCKAQHFRRNLLADGRFRVGRVADGVDLEKIGTSQSFCGGALDHSSQRRTCVNGR